jgi:hypothetical protein
MRPCQMAKQDIKLTPKPAATATPDSKCQLDMANGSSYGSGTQPANAKKHSVLPHNLTTTSNYNPDSKRQSHSLHPSERRGEERPISEYALNTTSSANYIVGDSWGPWLHVPTSTSFLN